MGALFIFVALTGYCDEAFGQNTTASAAGEQRVVIVMSDGTSSVHKPGNQQIKIRTALAESEMPLSQIVYIYRGKARIYSEKGVISGEVLESYVSMKTDDGGTKQIPVGEILFLSPVQARLSGKVIRRLEIIVADGKVTPTVFSDPAPSATPQRNFLETIGTGNRVANEPAAPASPGMSVVILDEYWVGRRYTLSNPHHSTVVQKVARRFPGQGPPFPLEFDVVAHQPDYEPDVTLFVPCTEKGSGRRMERSCRFILPDISRLVQGTKKRRKHDLGTCLSDLDGSGEVFASVAEAAESEVHEKELSKVKLYKTVSNVLRLPVRFE